jgi:site-specific DNA-methyltransferase (cytosine-N4-specific)
VSPPDKGRDIPFGPQFSPDQTPLAKLLKVAAAHGGNYDSLVAGIRSAFFERGTGTDYNKTKKADNTTLALRDYGILESDKSTLTALGKELLSLVHSPPHLHERFAKHILTQLNGIKFVSTVQDLLASGREISLETLPKALAQRGVHVPATSTHLSAMKGWLKMAGIFRGGRNSYEIDEERLSQVLGGVRPQDLSALADLDDLQRAFLKALASFPPQDWARSNGVAKLAEVRYGVQFPWKSIKASVLDDCAAAGLLLYKKTTTGRGAKPYLVKSTEKFGQEVLLPLLEKYRDPVQSRLRELFRTPIKKLVEDLKATDRHTKGKALELLALHLAFSLGLDFVAWRRRAAETGGAEVDVIVEDSRMAFAKWQIQCKNGPARVEDLAKEVGVAVALGSNVVLLLTTRRLTRDTRGFADVVMQRTNLQVILLDETDLRDILQSPARLVEALAKQAGHARLIKQRPSPSAQ